MKSKLSESLLPSVSVTVMVAVCTPGSKSKTSMLSTSWPAWGWNITTMFDVSLYRFKHRVDYNTVTSLLQDRKLTWYSGCTINRAHKCVLWTITDDNPTGIWIDRHLRIRRNITLDVNCLRCCISKNRKWLQWCMCILVYTHSCYSINSLLKLQFMSSLKCLSSKTHIYIIHLRCWREVSVQLPAQKCQCRPHSGYEVQVAVSNRQSEGSCLQVSQ